MKKAMIMALMALVCMTACAKGGKKQQQCGDTTRCCQPCPIPGIDRLSDDDKAKLKDIYTRYAEEIKNACPAAQGDCCRQECEKPQGDMAPQGPRHEPGDTAAMRLDGPRPDGPRPQGDMRPGSPDKKDQGQQCCQAPKLSDDEADALMQAELKARAEVIAIQQKYYSEFRTVLSPCQVKALYNAPCGAKQGAQQPRGPQRHGKPGQPGQPGGPGQPGQPGEPAPAPAQGAE